jgi:hypothetical protein
MGVTTNRPSEKEVARLWHSQSFDRKDLATEDGLPVEVISPGWPNDDRGPDFKQAVIQLGRVLTRGDIEIHIRSSSWREHGHHLDTGYNRVVLHVVLKHDTGTDIRLQNGTAVPTLVLSSDTPQPGGKSVPESSVINHHDLPCHRTDLRLHLEEFLDRSGEARFMIKGERFLKEMGHSDAGQCLYQGIMEALGYSKNKTPFLELAKRLPLNVLERMINTSPEANLIYEWQDLFFRVSGLVPADTGPPSGPGSQAAILPDDWRRVKVRPNNSPLTRLTAMSYILFRYRKEGLLNGLVNLVRDTSSGPDAHEKLEDGLTVRIPGYPAGITLLGSQRTSEIIINVLLPFTFVWSGTIRDNETGKKVLELYKQYPGSGLNSVERYMLRRLKTGSNTVYSALRRQGLIHIYKTLCGQGKCGVCGLSQFESG